MKDYTTALPPSDLSVVLNKHTGRPIYDSVAIAFTASVLIKYVVVDFSVTHQWIAQGLYIVTGWCITPFVCNIVFHAQ